MDSLTIYFLVIIGGFAGILTIVVSLIKPARIFSFVYPLLITIGQVPITIGQSNISLERFLVAVGGLGILGGIFFTKTVQLRSLPLLVVLGLGTWFFFYLIALIAFPTAYGFTIFIGYIQKAVMAYFVFISFSLPDQFSKVLKLFLLSSFIVSLFTIAVYFQEGSLMYIRQSSFIAGERISESIIRGIARAGADNTMALWISILFFWQVVNRKQGCLIIFLILWFLILSLFALRREVIVTIFCGIGIIAWHRPIGHRLRTISIGAVSVVIATIFILSSPEWMMRLRGETVMDFTSGKDIRSTLLFRFTPEAIKSSPMFGHGPGRYAVIQRDFPHLFNKEAIKRGGISAHNTWSATAVEAGIIALFGLCLFLYGIGRPLWKSYRISYQPFSTILAFAPLLFAQLLLKLFFGSALMLPYIWFWLGYLMALERTARQLNSKITVYAPAFHH